MSNLTKSFCLSELSILYQSFDAPYIYEPQLHAKRNHICVIEDGSLDLHHLNSNIHAEKGDIVFFPLGIQHTSKWSGTPHIKKYDCIFSFTNNILQNYPIQKVTIPDSLSKAKEIFVNLNDNFERIPFAFSAFYNFFGEILSSMVSSDSSILSDLLSKAHIYIYNNIQTDIKVSDIAKFCCVCEATIYKMFKEELRTTPINYANSLRISRALDYMSKKPNEKISSISALCGFNSEVHFRKTFYKYTKMTPSDYRKLVTN